MLGFDAPAAAPVSSAPAGAGGVDDLLSLGGPVAQAAPSAGGDVLGGVIPETKKPETGGGGDLVDLLGGGATS